MNNTIKLFHPKSVIKSIFLDVSALLLIYFTPALIHLTELPVYFIEPIRLMLILSIAYSSRINTFILALSLPLFSHIISSHPVFLKTILISFELVLFTFLFFELIKRYKNVFAVMILSITISKIFYYGFKYLFINYELIQTELISTPLYLQVVVSVIFSLFVSFAYNKNKPYNYKNKQI
jgi:hypothetical protein